MPQMVDGPLACAVKSSGRALQPIAAATIAPTAIAQTAHPRTLYGRGWLMVNSVKAGGGATPLCACHVRREPG